MSNRYTAILKRDGDWIAAAGEDYQEEPIAI